MSTLDNLKAMYGTTFSPDSMSGVTYTGDYGKPVELTYAQLDAIKNPTLGSESSSTGNWFKDNADGIKAGAEGLKALSGLANAYIGYKNYGLAKDMFGFQKAATNANYINAAKDYNTQLQNRADIGMGLAGNTMDANARAANQAQIDARKVSEAAIR